jgi:acyl-CoA synthetase (NDP forming)
MATIEEIFALAKKENRTILSEYESKEVLANIGIPITKQLLVREVKTKDATLTACSKIGYPVVMKLMAEDIVHKSDAGAVKLNLKTSADVEKAYAELLAIEAKGAKAISVQEMAKKPITEVIIGSLQDPQFGATIMFGIGGILVELMKDVSFRIAPLSDFDADEMIHEIKGFKLLDGFRGSAKADLENIKSLLKKVSELVFKYQEIAEMDLNPVFTYVDGVKCVDARIILK